MDAGPPSWDAEAKAFPFFLRKPGRDVNPRFGCARECRAIERPLRAGTEPIVDAHRLMIELRAAQKLNARLLDAVGSVLLGADDM
jgi:hypothetical protein